jgi:type II secretory pathway pseudopilin PulG
MGHHIFSSRPVRSAFSLKELLVVVVVISALLALLLPAIQHAREEQRKEACENNLKQIGLALLNYEDGRRCLPPISSNIDSVPDIPGDATATFEPKSQKGLRDSTGAGYSWIVHVLSEMEEGSLYQQIATNSKKFELSAFDPNLKVKGPRGQQHPATVAVPTLRCPSFSGGATIDMSPRTVGTTSGTIETGTVPPNYVGGIATAGGAKGLAITNYNGMIGTHIDPEDTFRRNEDIKSARTSNNGAMQFTGTAYDKARGTSAFTDGTANTLLIAETRERRFASWFDGTMNWVVAARHSNPSDGAKAIVPASLRPKGIPVNAAKARFHWIIGTDGTTATGGSALNYGPSRQTPTAVYLPTDSLTDPDISGIPPGRLWGPSSEHRGGIINHAFGDGHVESISENIDPNIYLRLTTRNYGEPSTTTP